MGTCNSNSKGGGSGGNIARNGLTLAGGEAIEFDGNLKFGKLDKSVPEAVRKNLDDWESKRYKNKIEYAMAFNSDGTPISREKRGSSGSVRTPYSFHYTENSVFTHNHPRESGLLGGTFSPSDLYNFTLGNNTTFRATAKEGTYSISKGKNFNSKGFNAYIGKVYQEFKNNDTKKFNALKNDYQSGKITYSQFQSQAAKSFNNSLIDLHNSYIAGQKQYGYTYTLEKRK